MFCKDCIHYDVCKCVNSKVDEMYGNRNGTQYGCGYFKDKSRFIDLPCNVGDEVVINGETYKCIGFSIAPPTNTVNLVNEKNKLFQPSIDEISNLKEFDNNA